MSRSVRPHLVVAPNDRSVSVRNGTRLLLRDRDASYGLIFCKSVEAMGITDLVTAQRSPWQNAYIEGVIGSIRRECLDKVVIFKERHSAAFSSYVDYYQDSRTHLSLGKDCPRSRPIQSPQNGRIIAVPLGRWITPSLRMPLECF